MKLLQFSIYFLCIIIGNFLPVEIALAQLQIAPTALYMDVNNSTERIVVRNSSDETIEVEIELIFGYPTTDEQGKVIFKHVSIVDNQHSAMDWIRIYPRTFELAPGERQTVRFAARPPDDLSQGEYWVRPAIVAHLPSVRYNNEGSNISTQLNLKKRTILALNYRNGIVNTGVTIENLSVELEENIITVTSNLQRLGTAAFIGHYTVLLIDSKGKTHKTEKKEIAIYNDQKRVFSFNSDGLESGTYIVELKLFTNERNTNGIIQASTSTSTSNFTIL